MGVITKGHRGIKILKEIITAYGGVKFLWRNIKYVYEGIEYGCRITSAQD